MAILPAPVTARWWHCWQKHVKRLIGSMNTLSPMAQGTKASRDYVRIIMRIITARISATPMAINCVFVVMNRRSEALSALFDVLHKSAEFSLGFPFVISVSKAGSGHGFAEIREVIDRIHARRTAA